MAERKRLPVIQEPRGAAEDEGPPRPPWHWVGFGTVAIFAAWLPLAYAASALARHALAGALGDPSSEEEVVKRLAAMSSGERLRIALLQTAPHVLALALASFAGGFLVGRFGPNAGAREAAVSGVAVSLVAIAVTLTQPGASFAVLIVAPIAIGFAWWGGRTGARGAKHEKKAPGK